MATSTKVDLSTIIKKHEGKGAGTYYYIKESGHDKREARLTAVDIGAIKTKIATREEKKRPVKDWEDFLLDNFDKAPLFCIHLEEAKIELKDAFDFMSKESSKTATGPVKKTDAEKLASILVSLAPVLTPEQLVEKLETMLKEHKEEALKLVKKMEAVNERDSNMWIYTTTPEQREKLKAAKKK